MLFDLPLEQLQTYQNPRPTPEGFVEFWQTTINESRAQATEVTATVVDSLLTGLEVYDVIFPGFNGDPINAWWILPQHIQLPVGTIIEFLGYGGGRGLPHERLLWANHGFGQLIVDSRAQGGVWNTGDTQDPHGSGPASPGLLTRGIESQYSLYYRRLLADAVLAVDAVTHLPGADPSRIATVGHSQGGAMALAAAALHPAVQATGARAPFLCGISRSVEICLEGPYTELQQYLAVYRLASATAFETLDFIDIANFCPLITCPTWVSVGLSDTICPPSGIFAAINAIQSITPTVRTWPFSGHEAGGAHDDSHLAGWLIDLLHQ